MLNPYKSCYIRDINLGNTCVYFEVVKHLEWKKCTMNLQIRSNINCRFKRTDVFFSNLFESHVVATTGTIRPETN